MADDPHGHDITSAMERALLGVYEEAVKRAASAIDEAWRLKWDDVVPGLRAQVAALEIDRDNWRAAAERVLRLDCCERHAGDPLPQVDSDTLAVAEMRCPACDAWIRARMADPGPTAADWERAVAEVRGNYPEAVFSADGTSPDAVGGQLARGICDAIARRAGEIAADPSGRPARLEPAAADASAVGALLAETFDLVDQVVDRIPDGEVEAKLRQAAGGEPEPAP